MEEHKNTLHEVITRQQQPTLERKGQGPVVQADLSNVFPLGRSGYVSPAQTSGGQGVVPNNSTVPLNAGVQTESTTSTPSVSSSDQGNAS